MNYEERREWIAQIEPGFYRLTSDVVNPRPDRRRKYDWLSAPVFKAGERFLVRKRNEGINALGVEIVLLELRKPGEPGYASGVELQDALLQSLRPETVADDADSPLEWAFEERGWTIQTAGGDVLAYLVRTGKVSIEDVHAGITAHEAQIDAAEAARTGAT